MRFSFRLQVSAAVLPALVVISLFVAWIANGLALDDSKPSKSEFMLGGNPQRNMVNRTDKNLPTEWSIQEGNQKNIKWVAQLGTVSYGGPSIGAGKVFVGTNNEKPRDTKVTGDKGILMCFNAADGKFLWQLAYEKLPNAMENDYPQQGVASTPSIDGSRLYYVSNNCQVNCVAIDKNPPEVLWRLDMIKDLNVFPRFLSNCSPLVVGDLVYLITSNGVDEKRQLPSPDAPSFLALDKMTGKVIWQSNAPGKKVLDGQWSNPVYAEVNGKGQAIFGGGDGWLYGFEAKTGKPMWKFDCNPKDAEFKVGGGTRNYIVATPVVNDNKVYIGVGRDPGNEGPGLGHLWCVDITKTGDLTPVDNNFDPMAPANKDSGLVWHFGGPSPPGADRPYLFGRTLSSCVIQDGFLYVADLDGFFYCLDAKTGAKLWDHDLKSGVWGSPSFMDGKIYLGNEDGDMYIFAAGKEKKLLGQVALEEPIKSTAVAIDGVLYVMTEKHLYAIGNK